jgi:hypothetical protein
MVPEVTVLAVLGVALAGSGGDDVGPRAAAVIEQASPAEHHDHGHEVTPDDRLFCGVDVFGVRGETVYGYYFCALGRPGVPYLESSRVDGPVVVTLGPTPSARIAPPGAGYADAVQAMMPDEYESRCFSGLPDPSVAAEVRRRYVQALGA